MIAHKCRCRLALGISEVTSRRLQGLEPPSEGRQELEAELSRAGAGVLREREGSCSLEEGPREPRGVFIVRANAE